MDLIDRQAAIECLNGKMKLSDFENAQIVQDFLARVVEKILDLPSARRWIPVGERLPEYGEKVLVTDDDGVTCGYLAEMWDGDFSWEEWHDTHRYLIEPTAWMPLPEPWKGDEE